MHVILLSRAASAAAKDADVVEKVRTASLMVRKSRADNEICCSSGAMVVGPGESIGATVLGAEGFEGREDAGVVGNGAVIARAGAEDVGI